MHIKTNWREIYILICDASIGNLGPVDASHIFTAAGRALAKHAAWGFELEKFVSAMQTTWQMIQWYISRCQLGRDGVYLAALAWQDGSKNPETNIPAPKHPCFILIMQ